MAIEGFNNRSGGHVFDNAKVFIVAVLWSTESPLDNDSTGERTVQMPFEIHSTAATVDLDGWLELQFIGDKSMDKQL